VRVGRTWHNLLAARVEEDGSVRLTFPGFETHLSPDAVLTAELRPERRELRT
jgi:hypothetical protein